MSLEGTLAGLLASFFLASVGCFLGQVIVLFATKISLHSFFMLLKTVIITRFLNFFSFWYLEHR